MEKIIFLNLFLTLLGGTITGIFIGMIPGLGVLAAMVIAIPLLATLQPTEIVFFYLGLIIASQFTGSMVATFFGIPGEITSIPASVAGYSLFKQGNGRDALVLAATGSLFAGCVTTLMIFLLFENLRDVTWIYSSKIYAVMMSLVVLYLIMMKKNYLTNLFLVIIGLFLGALGQNVSLQSYSMTFNQGWLTQGLDLPIFAMLSFVFPTLLMTSFEGKKTNTIKNNNKYNVLSDSKLFCKYLVPCFRGTTIGIIAGIIPAVGTAVCSNIAWVIEKSIKPLNYRSQLISAESANNSANLISLIPVILFGLPILASEAIMIELTRSKNGNIGFEWFNEHIGYFSRMELLCLSSILISFFMYFLSTRYAMRVINLVNKIPFYFIKFVLPICITLFLLFDLYLDHNIQIGLFTLLIGSIICFMAVKYKINTLPVLFSFLISSQFLLSLTVVYNIMVV